MQEATWSSPAFSSLTETGMMQTILKVLNRMLDHLVCAGLQAFQRKIRKPILVGAEQYGRVGNRLYLGAHLIAWAHRRNALLLHPGVHDYEDLFEGTCRDALVRYPEPREPLCLPPAPKAMLRQSIDRLSIYFLNREHSTFQTLDLQPEGPDIAKTTFFDDLTAKPVNFIRGFIYDNTCTHIVDAYPEIRHHYRPRQCYLPAIECPIRNLRMACDLVLGIVIRHGDFKSWQGGKFFFATTEYVQFMDECTDLLPDKKIGFFIASDEEQDPNLFEHHTFHFRAGHPVENLYTLAACDGMLAAESSFTGWSQYYGNVPVWFMRRDSDRDSFRKMLDNALQKAAGRKQGQAA